MWLVIAELIVDGGLAPFGIASLILFAANRTVDDRLKALASAGAIVLAVCVAGLLAFGWPISGTLTARTKIMIASLMGFALGIVITSRVGGIGPIVLFGLVTIVVWIGQPALQQGRWDGIFLVMLVTAVTLLSARLYRADGNDSGPRLLIIVIFAFGLAILAAFARSLSYSVFAFALMSALLATLWIGKSTLPSSAVVTIEATMLALVSALLLYTDMSRLALLVLCTVFAAEHIARLAWRHDGPPPQRYIFSFSIAPAALAILLARIDAGAISIY